MNCDVRLINQSSDTPIPAVFIDPIGGGSGLYVSQLKPSSSQVVPYPTALGPKVLISFSFDGILLLGGDFDLSGLTSCELLVSMASGYPSVSLGNVVRN